MGEGGECWAEVQYEWCVDTRTHSAGVLVMSMVKSARSAPSLTSVSVAVRDSATVTMPKYTPLLGSRLMTRRLMRAFSGMANGPVSPRHGMVVSMSSLSRGSNLTVSVHDMPADMAPGNVYEMSKKSLYSSSTDSTWLA